MVKICNRFSLGILIILGTIYRSFFYPKRKFKDKKYIRNKELLMFDYKEDFDSSLYLLIMGVTLIVSGFLIVTIWRPIFYFFIIIGLCFMLVALIENSSAHRKAKAIRKILKEEN